MTTASRATAPARARAGRAETFATGNFRNALHRVQSIGPLCEIHARVHRLAESGRGLRHCGRRGPAEPGPGLRLPDDRTALLTGCGCVRMPAYNRLTLV